MMSILAFDLQIINNILDNRMRRLGLILSHINMPTRGANYRYTLEAELIALLIITIMIETSTLILSLRVGFYLLIG